MKIKTRVDGKSLFSDISLFDDKSIPKKDRLTVSEEIGEMLVEKTLSSVATAKSPVLDASYKSTLSDEYKKWKKAEGRGDKANLELYGNMLDELDYRATPTGVKIGFFDTPEALKADGHNNFSGDSQLPERRFLPKDGESYKPDIQSEIDNIINEHIVKSKEITDGELKDIESKTDLWDLFRNKYPGIEDDSDLRSAIIGDEDLMALLDEYGMLKWLRL